MAGRATPNIVSMLHGRVTVCGGVCVRVHSVWLLVCASYVEQCALCAAQIMHELHDCGIGQLAKMANGWTSEDVQLLLLRPQTFSSIKREPNVNDLHVAPLSANREPAPCVGFDGKWTRLTTHQGNMMMIIIFSPNEHR